MVEFKRGSGTQVSPLKPEADSAAGKATQKMTSLIEDFSDKADKPTDQIEEIKELVDPSAGTLKRSLENLTEHIEKDQVNGVRTLVFVHFSGHGYRRSGYYNCILNELGLFNLEKRLI